MCSRYKIEPIKDGWAALATLLSQADLESLRTQEPRLDIRPTQRVPVIRWAKGEPTPKLVTMRWGFIPSWWKQPKPPQNTINARCEEALDKRMWPPAVRYSRCLIACTGWYEWVPVFNQDTGEIKTKPNGTPVKAPVEMRNPLSPTICFAGLWSRTTFAGEDMETCAIVTRAAVPPLARVHDRMPVIVSPDGYHEWLDPTQNDVALFERVTQAEPPAKFEVLQRGPGRLLDLIGIPLL